MMPVMVMPVMIVRGLRTSWPGRGTNEERLLYAGQIGWRLA
jgi:hypothetical protein